MVIYAELRAEAIQILILDVAAAAIKCHDLGRRAAGVLDELNGGYLQV
jgi:hypothetical protein